jgi:hypothetical protein
MDALVKEALNRVNETVLNIPEDKIYSKPSKYAVIEDRSECINKAIIAIDALKCTIKTLP